MIKEEKIMKKNKELLNEMEESIEKISKYTCEICCDTGMVDVMDQVYDNEPHMANVGCRRCECTL